MTKTNDRPLTRRPCAACGDLAAEEHAYQKYGRDEDNSYLPAAAAALELVRDLRPYGSRKLQLWQCPECGAYFLYRSDYEYLANGSEDEEWLTRLTAGEAVEYLSV